MLNWRRIIYALLCFCIMCRLYIPVFSSKCFIFENTKPTYKIFMMLTQSCPKTVYMSYNENFVRHGTQYCGAGSSSVAVQQLMSFALQQAAPPYRGSEYCRAGGVIGRYTVTQLPEGSTFSLTPVQLLSYKFPQLHLKNSSKQKH